MNNEDNLVIHTFNTDIEEELKKKDANILDITNANNNELIVIGRCSALSAQPYPFAHSIL